jgi:hypothetical protein
MRQYRWPLPSATVDSDLFFVVIEGEAVRIGFRRMENVQQGIQGIYSIWLRR